MSICIIVVTQLLEKHCFLFHSTTKKAADTFLKDACQTLGIIKDSPLSIVTNAGCVALPALLNIKQVMISRQVPGIWSGRDELPVSIILKLCCHFRIENQIWIWIFFCLRSKST